MRKLIIAIILFILGFVGYSQTVKGVLVLPDNHTQFGTIYGVGQPVMLSDSNPTRMYELTHGNTLTSDSMLTMYRRGWVKVVGFFMVATESDPYSFHKNDSNTKYNPITLSYFLHRYFAQKSIDTIGNFTGILKAVSGVVSAITDNSAAWNNARAVSNHDSLYFLKEKNYNDLTNRPKIPDSSKLVAIKDSNVEAPKYYVTVKYVNDNNPWAVSGGSTVQKTAMNVIFGSTITAGGQTLTFPTGAGTNNYVLTTDGSGNLSWSDKSGGTPGTITSLNGSSSSAQTIAGTSPLRVIESGTGSYIHTISLNPDTLTDWWAKQNKGVVAYNWGQWHDTLLTRIYQDWGTLVSGSAPNYTIKADTSKMVTFGDTAIVGGKIQSKYQYKLRNGDKNGQLPYWDVGLQMWIPSQHMSWNDTSDIFTTKNIYAGGTITANTNLIINSLKNILGNSYSDTTVVDSSGYLKRGLKAVYQYEIGSDAENNITVPFSLKSTTSVYYNGIAIPNTRWSGVGTAVLYVSLDTRKYDKIIIQR